MGLGGPVPTVILERTERPANKTSVTKLETQTTSANSYQKLVEWVPTPLGGVLKEISVTPEKANNKGLFRIVVEDADQFIDKTLFTNLTLPFDRMEVASGKANRVEFKSSDGSPVTATASILAEQKL